MAATKQVIVMRTDLGMRKGKMVAQGAHASLGWLTRQRHRGILLVDFSAAEQDWLENSYVKICVGVGSLEELNDVYNAALEAGLLAQWVTDNGTTEFHGEPTPTCIAIGPDWSDSIDEVTGHLKLL